MKLTEQVVFDALKECRDPEIPVNLVDLGLIYDVRIPARDTVHVRMTLTARGCPMHQSITDSVRDRLEAIDGVRSVEVELVWDPPWSKEMISEAGKRVLGLI